MMMPPDYKTLWRHRAFVHSAVTRNVPFEETFGYHILQAGILFLA